MKRILLGIFLTIFVLSAYAKPKSVGVVMSGGGAKGFYHIGVLRALEENNIPIDYVAGTSMGAIIAGFYASGYSVEQITQIALSDQIARWAQGEIDPRYGYYYQTTSTLMRGEAKLNFRSRVKGGKIDYKPTIAQGLVSTIPVDMALSSLFAPAQEICKGDFSKLMIPFFCVASDVGAAKPFVIDHGDLGLALRSSMSLPLMYKPIIDKQGRVLYDGGLFDNFPTRPMEKMYNPDLLIGSHCDAQGESTDHSQLNLTDQILMLTTKRSSNYIPKDGVLIAGKVEGSMMDFSRASEIIEQGYSDALSYMDEIKARVGEENLCDSAYYDKRRVAFNKRKKDLMFGDYQIEGLSEYQQKYAERYTKHLKKKDNDGVRELNFEELERNLYSILSTRDFDTEFPVIEYNEKNLNFDFSIKMEQKPPLRFAIDAFLSSTPYNQLYLGAEYFKVDRTARRLALELYLGPVYNTGRFVMRQDFFLHTPLFVDSYINFSTQRLDLGSFSSLTPINNVYGLTDSDVHFSLGVGAPLGRRAQLLLRSNAGINWLKYDAEDVWYMFQDWTSERSRLLYWASKAEFDLSTLDNNYAPTSGSQIKLSAVNVVAKEKMKLVDFESSSEYERKYESDNHIWQGIRLNLLHYFNSFENKTYSLGVMGELLYTNIDNMDSGIANERFLPRFSPTTHSRMINMPQFSEPMYMAFGAMGKLKLWKNLYFDAQFYAMMSPNDYFDDVILNPEDLGGEILDNEDLKYNYILQTGFEYQTSLGPISLNATKYGLKDWDNMYLVFSFGHMIFSPRGTFY